jgi:hypothetical protein
MPEDVPPGVFEWRCRAVLRIGKIFNVPACDLLTIPAISVFPIQKLKTQNMKLLKLNPELRSASHPASFSSPQQASRLTAHALEEYLAGLPVFIPLAFI